MAKPQAIDMTQGNPLPQLIRFTLPMLVGNIFQQFYSMVDAMVVGRFVGVNAFAAIGATNSVLYLMISLIIGFTVGTSVVTAQAMGAKDKEKLRAIGGLAVVMAAGLAVVLGLGGGACSRAVLRLLHTPQDIYTDAVAYLTFNFATCLAPIAYNLVSSMLRSMGDSKTPLYALVLSSAVNIALDLLFVLCFHMGVVGVALATALAQALSALFCMAALVRHHPYMALTWRCIRVRRDLLFDILRIGLPMALQNLMTSLGMMAVQRLINRFGSVVVAGYAAAAKVDQIGIQPMNALGNAMSTYAGQNLGANRPERIHEGVRKAVLLSVALCLALSAAILLAGRPLLEWVVGARETEVIAVAREYLVIVSSFYFVGSLMYIYMNTLRGMGQALLPTLAGFVELFVKVGAAYGMALCLSYHALWFAWPLGWAAATALLITAYARLRRTAGTQQV